MLVLGQSWLTTVSVLFWLDTRPLPIFRVVGSFMLAYGTRAVAGSPSFLWFFVGGQLLPFPKLTTWISRQNIKQAHTVTTLSVPCTGMRRRARNLIHSQSRACISDKVYVFQHSKFSTSWARSQVDIRSRVEESGDSTVRRAYLSYREDNSLLPGIKSSSRLIPA